MQLISSYGDLNGLGNRNEFIEMISNRSWTCQDDMNKRFWWQESIRIGRIRCFSWRRSRMRRRIMKELIGTLPSGSETLNRYDTQENRWHQRHRAFIFQGTLSHRVFDTCTSFVSALSIFLSFSLSLFFLYLPLLPSTPLFFLFFFCFWVEGE